MDLDSRLFYVMLFFAILGLVIILKILVFRVYPFVEQYALTEEMDLAARYGKGSWALVTGPSSGMGERFAHELADRGFNLVLVGSKNTPKVIKSIAARHPGLQVRFVEKDFSKSFEENFFQEIEKALEGIDLSVLINNVGYRTACADYTKMSPDEMRRTISVGTMVQARLIQIALVRFRDRKGKCAIVNVTAQNSICTDLLAVESDLTVPHLACYEATNAWGYFHAKSVYEEIRDKWPHIDFLNVTPGATSTKKVKKVLENTMFSVDAETYVKNILKLMGNYNGTYCAHWGHSVSGALINVFPFFDRKQVLHKVGRDFADLYAPMHLV